MTSALSISIGQHSEAGRKQTNQDFHGAIVPEASALRFKGIVLAIADGISSSPVGHLAAQTAIKSFLSDYYCTSDAWTVRAAAQRVIAAANSWLYAETRREQVYDMDRGYVTTFSALVLKGRHGHVLHVGDSRVSRLVGGTFQQLTQDHKVILSSQENYLGRALGMAANVEIDYSTVPIKVGDTFVLTTDGVHDHVDARIMAELVAAHADDLDQAARQIVATALNQGSSDNLTVQIVRVEGLSTPDAADVLAEADLRPPPMVPEPGSVFDGWRIVRRLHGSSRSHLFEALDEHSGARVALKVPSVDLGENADYLRHFVMEEWIARRLSNPHLLRAHVQERPRAHLYSTMQIVGGQTLTQWMAANPSPDMAVVRPIIAQTARALQAMHRLEMVHQDLRPDNVMIDADGKVTLIDFGSTKVAGVTEAAPDLGDEAILGTLQYAAPEYFVGDSGTAQSDIYSLGVTAYQMLTGKLPYGGQISRARTRKAQRALPYQPAASDDNGVPAWVDAALRKAVHVDPRQRYTEVAELVADLERPNRDLPGQRRSATAERNHLLFWQLISLVLAIALMISLAGRVLP